MSKILITGAAGFIGSQLAHALWQQGNEVVLVDDFSYGQEDNLVFTDHDFRQEILRADICNRDFMYSLCEEQKFDFIYHIAAVTPLPDCQTDPAGAVAVNVAGAVNVLEAARRFMRGGLERWSLPAHRLFMKTAAYFHAGKRMRCRRALFIRAESMRRNSFVKAMQMCMA